MGRLIFIGLAYFSLVPALYLNMGFMETDAGGPIMPFMFIVITLAVIATAVSFAVMSGRGLGRQQLHLGLGMDLAHPRPVAGLDHDHDVLGGVGAVPAVIVIGVMNDSNIELSSAIIGTLMILETAFVAVLAVIIVARGGALGHLSSEPFDRSRGHGRLLRDLARHHVRVPVHRRGGQHRAGGRGVAHAAAADPAGHHGDDAAGRGVLDAELVQLRDRACRSGRWPTTCSQGQITPMPAHRPALHRRVRGPGRDRRLHRHDRQLRRPACTRPAGA